MIWRFLTAVLMLVTASAWTAGQCPAEGCQQQVVVSAVQPQVVLVPTYFASYVPPPATPPEAPARSDDVNQAILAELKALNKSVAELKNLLLNPDAVTVPPGTPGKLPAPSAVDPVAATVSRVIGTSCVKCHQAAVAEDKGGGFVMVGADNKTPQFTPADLRRIRARVGDGSMPKGQNKLTEPEKQAMLSFFAK